MAQDNSGTPESDEGRVVWESWFERVLCGGAEGIRTPDLCSAIAALSQLSYGPDGDRILAAGACVKRRAPTRSTGRGGTVAASPSAGTARETPRAGRCRRGCILAGPGSICRTAPRGPGAIRVCPTRTARPAGASVRAPHPGGCRVVASRFLRMMLRLNRLRRAGGAGMRTSLAAGQGGVVCSVRSLAALHRRRGAAICRPSQ